MFMCVCVYDIQWIASHSRLSEFEAEAERTSFIIVGLSKTCKFKCGYIDLPSNQALNYTDDDNKTITTGVGFNTHTWLTAIARLGFKIMEIMKIIEIMEIMEIMELLEIMDSGSSCSPDLAPSD
uniref:Uncharacterized protein n=1 Tax=Plectus sambesii TaxID=2011161 RepID=A0A914VEI9_9BILA